MGIYTSMEAYYVLSPDKTSKNITDAEKSNSLQDVRIFNSSECWEVPLCMCGHCLSAGPLL